MTTLAGVRQIRERLALSQDELAERAGVHRITIMMAEAGRSVRVGLRRELRRPGSSGNVPRFDWQVQLPGPLDRPSPL